jgi:hypothetical protein
MEERGKRRKWEEKQIKEVKKTAVEEVGRKIIERGRKIGWGCGCLFYG